MTRTIDYTRDMVSFCRKLYPTEGAYPAMLIPPFLESWIYTAFPKETGHPVARNVLHSTSKKQGKSTLAGAVALYMASRARYSEVIIAAADKDQAKDRVFRSVKYAVETHPIWNKAAVFKDTIELSNKSVIRAIPFDWRGAAGGDYAAVIFDELHVYTTEAHRRLFDELVIPPTRPNGVRWIASYAGFLNESILLKEIWDRAIAGEQVLDGLPVYYVKDASLLAMIDQGEASWRMPWMTRKFVEETQQTERPNSFRRLWLNEWVSAESEFISREGWAGCYSPDVKPLTLGDTRRVVFGADASTSRDLTALVGVVYDPKADLADVVYVRTWKPAALAHAGAFLRGGKPTIDLSESIGAEIQRLHQAGQVEAVYYDPYQLHSIGVDLTKAGVRMIELPQTAQRTEADQALYDAIIAKSLRHYGDQALTEHLMNAVAVETVRGFRLAKEKTTRKIDASVALSMAHYGAIQRQKVIGESWSIPNIFYDHAKEDGSPGDLGQWVNVGGKWDYLPARSLQHSAGATSWRDCRNRNKGCEACIAELEAEGEYERQEKEAELSRAQGGGGNKPIEEWTQEELDYLAKSTGIYWQIRQEMEDQRNEHKTRSVFRKNVARRLARSGQADRGTTGGDQGEQ